MKQLRRRRIGWWGASVAAALAAGTWAAYSYDIQRIRVRVTQGSETLATSQAVVEFTTWGSGPAVLVIHGAGGGYDQGSLIAQAFGGEGLRFVVPSRFGYLRSSLPADASTRAQAEAFAELLDALEIERVAILAMSGGCPPALQFARLYPARTAALVLVSSAPFTPLTAETQRLPVPASVYQALFGSDFPYWAIQRVGEPLLARMFDVPASLRATLGPEDAAFVSAMVRSFQPVSQRQEGLNNEGAAIDPSAHYDLEGIAAPTLVIHAQDDGINPFPIGEYAARHIPGAELLSVAQGGHLLLGYHDEVRARVSPFLRQ